VNVSGTTKTPSPNRKDDKLKPADGNVEGPSMIFDQEHEPHSYVSNQCYCEYAGVPIFVRVQSEWDRMITIASSLNHQHIKS
jgi:hypothetical protein